MKCYFHPNINPGHSDTYNMLFKKRYVQLKLDEIWIINKDYINIYRYKIGYDNNNEQKR